MNKSNINKFKFFFIEIKKNLNLFIFDLFIGFEFILIILIILKFVKLKFFFKMTYFFQKTFYLVFLGIIFVINQNIIFQNIYIRLLIYFFNTFFFFQCLAIIFLFESRFIDDNNFLNTNSRFFDLLIVFKMILITNYPSVKFLQIKIFISIIIAIDINIFIVLMKKNVFSNYSIRKNFKILFFTHFISQCILIIFYFLKINIKTEVIILILILSFIMSNSIFQENIVETLNTKNIKEIYFDLKSNSTNSGKIIFNLNIKKQIFFLQKKLNLNVLKSNKINKNYDFYRDMIINYLLKDLDRKFNFEKAKFLLEIFVFDKKNILHCQNLILKLKNMKMNLINQYDILFIEYYLKNYYKNIFIESKNDLILKKSIQSSSNINKMENYIIEIFEIFFSIIVKIVK